MTLRESGPCQVPPGFRFHPTDEELVNYYLRKKLALEKFDLEVIRDVDLNKLEPWDLRERCRIDSAQQAEWYFFSHKDKKYPTGTRTNRATAAGFWKATGRDKAVHSSYKRIGMRKTLVFYTGRAPHGQKTDWIMHEYRLEDYETGMPDNEDWVVCRVFKKRILQQKSEHCQSLRLASEEDQQSSLVDSNLEYYKSIHVDGNNTATDLSFYCKQEASDLDEFDLPRAPFLHLPQLESPKHTSHTAFSNVSDRGKEIFSEINYCNRPEFPSPFSLEMPGLESNSMAKSLFSCDDNLSDSYGDSGQMNYGWSILETIPKGEKYSSEFSDIAPLPLLASRVHQQAIDQYLPTCSSEADLWNFIS